MSVPLAKLLLPESTPLMLAGLLYVGAGVGLAAARLVRQGAAGREAPLGSSDRRLLVGVILAGGVAGPVLLLTGLQRVPAVVGSLLLNLEAPLTIVFAVALFREHLGLTEAAGALAITAGGVVLAGGSGPVRADWLGIASIVGACLCWAIDNNLTQRLSLRDPVAIGSAKGLGAGIVSLVLAFGLGHALPSASRVAAALALGFASYGVSVVLAIHALRHLGAAREAALFSTAPFLGALAAVPLLGEQFGLRELTAASMMAGGVWFLLRHRHDHLHEHIWMAHDHAHVHDEHHEHHAGDVGVEPHAHPHVHSPVTHSHPHVSDLHHRHRH